MSEFTHVELRKARELRKLTRWQLGNMIGVSESTIERWERGEGIPTSSDVDSIGEALEIPTLWHDWMCSNDEPYRKRYSKVANVELPVAFMRVRHGMEDVQAMQGAIERDAVDGVIDDKTQGEVYKAALREHIANATDLLQRLG